MEEPSQTSHAIKGMYDGCVIVVRTSVGETNEVPITLGLHQESALSLHTFALVIDKILRCVLFADDIVLVDESREGVNKRLEIGRKVLGSKEFK